MSEVPLRINLHPNRAAAAKAASLVASEIIRQAIADRGEARVVGATGGSQLEFVGYMAEAEGIDWSKVEFFHMDEYIGMSIDHPASFRRYLLDRLIVPAGITRYHLLDGETDAAETCRRVSAEIAKAPIDIVFAGIGENGHLAFNDPPADFETEDPYIVVELDEVCRRQQLGEGWFPTFDDVPTHAMSISIKQIMKAKHVVTLVPDERKAAAVKLCLDGPIGPEAPASILRQHPGNQFFMDEPAVSQLSPEFLDQHAVRA